MSEGIRRIARCPSTPTTGTRRTTSLPDELMSEQVRRLATFSAVIGGLWAFAVVLEVTLVPYIRPDRSIDLRALVLEAVWTVVAVVMFVYTKRAHTAAEHKSNAAIAFLVINAIGIALLNTWMTPANIVPHLHVSWVAILILVFSMIAPTSPRRTLVASLAAASMDPLAMWLAALGGQPLQSATAAFLDVLPNYICAVVAVVPAKALQHLGRRMKEAQELGSYQLMELLGRGGMGEVWRAEHRLLARSAAVKLVRPEVLGAGSDVDARVILRRFEREARATAALSSPHTINVFDFGMTNDGTFYYVMELLSGRDLETLVREFGPLPADRVVFLLRQICHSLADAHARGLVHRDIKPANIYVCRMGLEYDFVKVLDFGLVKLNDRSSGRTTLLTMDHRTTGTPAYMAPEIILGEAEVDRRADVYALGCVLYFLLTGQLVFEAETPMKVLMQHIQAAPIPPSQRTELPIPKALDELVLKCLAKDPNHRPQHAEELLALSYSSCSCGGWSLESSQHWWEQHLPDLTGPLTMTDVRQQAGSTVGVAL
jgi:eukaryotic-like serine/threonine-protein kinase